ncbi:possible oligopeptide transport system permease [Carnobacterium sp. AT7]|nr:possible oligopeptide transport system permease [Carnobacterium sp. AT7]
MKQTILLITLPAGIILLVSLSYSLPLNIGNLKLLLEMVKESIIQIFTYQYLSDLFITYQHTNGGYTLKLISASLAITLFSLLIYSYYFPKMKNKTVLRLIRYLEDIESLPVLGIVFFVHWLSVVIYKETSIYLFKTVGTPREPAIIIPLVILSIFPIIFLVKYMTPYIKDVYQSNYFVFAKSLGYPKYKLFFSYVIPNLLPFLENIMKFIYLEMITVMLFIEIQFNTGGLLTGLRNTQFIPSNTTSPQTMVISYLFLLLFPYVLMSLFFRTIHFFNYKK